MSECRAGHALGTPLEVLRFPLSGSRLIEASAGTGKTFTIATLYVRLVLGHGGPQAFPRPLMPSQILVVTFTQAATEELRDRIRGRLAQAAAYFLAEPSQVSPRPQGEDLLHDLRQDYAPQEWSACARTLQCAVQAMDEAAIVTIHGWCNRMLSEHAFESNSLFQQTLITHPEPLLAEVVRDYWRTYMAVLDVPSAQEVRAWWLGPDALQAQIMPLLREVFQEEPCRTVCREVDHEASYEMAHDSPREVFQGLSQPSLRAGKTVCREVDHESDHEASDEMAHDSPREVFQGLSQPSLRAAPVVLLRRAREQRIAKLAELKHPWPRWLPELRQIFDEGVRNKCVNGRQIQARYYGAWLESLHTWCEDSTAIEVGLSATAWERLSTGLAAAWKGSPPEHPAFTALAQLREQLRTLPVAKPDILCHAAQWVCERWEKSQAQGAHISFDSLLDQLHKALTVPRGQRGLETRVEMNLETKDLETKNNLQLSSNLENESENEPKNFEPEFAKCFSADFPDLPESFSEKFAATLRAQFPVALIDEFQDTDQIQYNIFNAVYRIACNDPHCALILIGDPKQAIYGFRGADIYTYLQARAEVGTRLYILKKNFRSTAATVAAVNHCFGVAEQHPEGMGAFLFRRAQGNPVPFIPAQAQGRADDFRVLGTQVPALNVWCLPDHDSGKAFGAGLYLQDMADVCAAEIVRLLTLAQQGKAGFRASCGHHTLTPLRPSDIAILVNTARQAHTIRLALSRRGVCSTYLSEGRSVFASAQAGEIERWLQACVEPDNGRFLRTALATPTLGVSWLDLDRLSHDELAWEARLEQFRAYGKCWREQGVLPMLRRLLDDFNVPARQLSQEVLHRERHTNGERVLTDILHIAELLQQASTQIDGEYALIRHLAQMRHAAEQGEENDALTIRLEDDGDLVRVITVHKSKGLEYPLVFLPYAVAFRPVAPDAQPLVWHDAAFKRCVSLVPDAAGHAHADRERLGEDLRKLYVALTRARYATWVGCAPIANVTSSAFGYLVSCGQDRERQLSWSTILAAWQAGHPHIAVQTVAQPSWERYQQKTIPWHSRQARVMQRAVQDTWEIVSYSSLSAVSTSDEGRMTGSARAAISLEMSSPALKNLGVMRVPIENGVVAGDLHHFPAGPEAGTFLHELLNWSAIQGFHVVASQRDAVCDAIAHRSRAYPGWSAWVETLADWLQDFVTREMKVPHLAAGGGAALTLSTLTTYLAEMEFWLGVHVMQAGQLDRIVRRYTLAGAARSPLAPARVHGMLKGFIDLVFEHEGRYYILDYKSNWLGPNNEAYTPAAMRQAVLTHRYELQYALYLFALHRLLRSRLTDYDYDRHIGGVLYVFLRGTRAASGGLFFERPPVAMMHALDRLVGVAEHQDIL